MYVVIKQDIPMFLSLQQVVLSLSSVVTTVFFKKNYPFICSFLISLQEVAFPTSLLVTMVNVLIKSRNVMKTSIMTVEITVMKRDVVWFNTLLLRVHIHVYSIIILVYIASTRIVQISGSIIVQCIQCWRYSLSTL